MDKYYTPDLEEFHQGFEYERWSSSAYTSEKYIKEVFEFVDKDYIWDDDVTNMLACAYNGGDALRVKLLDKEDIESLGWKFRTDLYVKKDLTLQVYKNLITIRYYDNFNNEWKTCVRQINIKNKSELKKLLKQLQIG